MLDEFCRAVLFRSCRYLDGMDWFMLVLVASVAGFVLFLIVGGLISAYVHFFHYTYKKEPYASDGVITDKVYKTATARFNPATKTTTAEPSEFRIYYKTPHFESRIDSRDLFLALPVKTKVRVRGIVTWKFHKDEPHTRLFHKMKKSVV